MARIGPEARLAVGNIEAVDIPDKDIANLVVKDLVSGHALGIDESGSKDDIAMIVFDGIDEIADIMRIMLAIAISGHYDIGCKMLGSLYAGFGGCAFAAIEPVPSSTTSI